MKPGRELLKWLLLCVTALLVMSITLAGCAQGETTPSQEAAGGTAPSEEAAGETTPSENAAGGATPSQEAAGGTAPSQEAAEEATPSVEAVEETAPSVEVARIGEESSNEQAAVTVHSVEFYDQITGGMGGTYKPSEEGDVFAIVDLTIKNISGAILKISPVYVRLLDNQDNRCPRPMVIIAGQPYELKSLSSEELASGEEKRGMVVFTVKEGTILSTVSYTTPEPAIDIRLEGLEVYLPTYRMPQVGEIASGGGIEMMVSSIGSIEKLEKEYGEDAEYFNLILTETAKPGQELLVLDLSIKNVFIEPDITINPLYVLLIDTESNAYGKVPITIALEGLLGLTGLSPGEETWGRLLFSVPAGTVLDRVMYKIGALGPPVQVSLR